MTNFRPVKNFSCQICNKFFISEELLVIHDKTKKHKRTVKLLSEEPYTQREAENAAGLF